jgi:tetratricopeptide (TPR) repeat protein
LKPEDAIEHFQKSHQWATRLEQQTTNPGLLNLSAVMKGWAHGNISEVMIKMGRCEEAITEITEYFLPRLARLRERGNSEQSTDIGDLWDLKCLNDGLGMAYYRMDRYTEALPYFREALRFIELVNQRRAHSAQFSSAWALVRAEVGEVLLRLNEPEEGLHLLRGPKNWRTTLRTATPPTRVLLRSRSKYAGAVPPDALPGRTTLRRL